MCVVLDRGGLGRDAVVVAEESGAVGAHHQARSDLEVDDLAGEEDALHGDMDLYSSQFGCSDQKWRVDTARHTGVWSEMA